MKIIPFLLLLGVCLGQEPFGTRPPVAGAAEWVASLRYVPDNITAFNNTVSYTRYVQLKQDPVLKQWNSLGNSFTVEFQFSFDPPVSSPISGSWKIPESEVANETRFLPLINRHPGMGVNNEWSHFSIHLTRTSQGVVLVAWVGCGCDAGVFDRTPGGEQANLQSCGFGYLLHSDHNETKGGPMYIIPGVWYNVAFTFDGDGTEVDTYKSRLAKMYVNGTNILTNKWGEPANTPQRGGVCKNRPMQWFRNEIGIMDSITLGYLDNQDDPSRTDLNGNPMNEFTKYGINAFVDEIRIWKEVRSDSQIASWWDLTLEQRDLKQPSLVAYYNWNRLPPTQDVSRKFPNEKTYNDTNPTTKGSPWGLIHSSGINPPDRATLWQGSQAETGNNGETFPTTNSRVTVIAKRQETSTKTIPNFFTFRGLDPDPSSPSVGPISSVETPALFPPFENFRFRIFDFSLPWRLAEAAKELLLYRQSNGAEVNSTTIISDQFQRNETLGLEMNCTNVLCTNFFGNSTFRDWWIEYEALTPPPVTPRAILYFNIESECDGHYDACGVCNGRNETCQCVVYNNFRNVRMAYVLLVYMMDYLKDQIDHTTEIMQESLELVSKPSFRAELMSDEVEEQIRDLMKFYNGCLEDYCSNIAMFNENLKYHIPKVNPPTIPTAPNKRDLEFGEASEDQNRDSVPKLEANQATHHLLFE